MTPEAAITELCAAGHGNVCFDADGVLWREDVGNEYLASCIARGILQPEQRALAEAAWSMPDPQMAEACVQVLAGLRESYVAADAREFVQSRFRQHLIPEIAAWIARLHDAGVACWVVSGSNRWIVAAGAEMVGIPAERVLAVSVAVHDGVLTGDIERPVTYGPGKAEAIRARLPALPEMCFGNTEQDIPMLRLATKLAVAIEPDAALLTEATSQGWAIQKYLTADERR